MKSAKKKGGKKKVEKFLNRLGFAEYNFLVINDRSITKNGLVDHCFILRNASPRRQNDQSLESCTYHAIQ